MTLRIAINGFGRIGRMVLRAFAEQAPKDIEVIAINDLSPLETSLHLFQYDSVHGRYDRPVSHDNNSFNIGFGDIQYLQEANPVQLPWKNLGVDIVFECSGRFTSKQDASQHLSAGAKRVLISAPGKDADITVVYGVNHNQITPSHEIISNASCTTNCLAPVASVLHQAIGIKHGYMTTIHAYTGDQRLVDTGHSDLRRARAGAMSMIPTSTGAAKAVGLVLPELSGKLDGSAIRVPTPNVSLVDLTFTASQKTSIKEVNSAIRNASESALKGILAYNSEPLVSVDFNHHPASSIFDATQTQVLDDTLVRIVTWYDNEWGFSNRMIDLARHLVTPQHL